MRPARASLRTLGMERQPNDPPQIQMAAPSPLQPGNTRQTMSKPTIPLPGRTHNHERVLSLRTTHNDEIPTKISPSTPLPHRNSSEGPPTSPRPPRGLLMVTFEAGQPSILCS